MPTKKATPLDYKKVFSDQVRKGFTGDHNMNVAQGAYTMIKGSSAKNIDVTPMHGTIGQMKDKAAINYAASGKMDGSEFALNRPLLREVNAKLKAMSNYEGSEQGSQV